MFAQSQWTKGGRGTHWEITAAWCHSAATIRGVLPINDRFNQPTQDDVSWRPSSTMRWDQGSNKHRAVPCTECHLTTAALEAEKRDTQIFGEEFSQSLFYVIKKIWMWMKGRTAQKKILKTPTQPANKAKYSQKKGITLILFNHINFPFSTSTQIVSTPVRTRGFPHCGPSDISPYRGSRTWLICTDWCVDTSHSVRPALGCKPRHFFFPSKALLWVHELGSLMWDQVHQ